MHINIIIMYHDNYIHVLWHYITDINLNGLYVIYFLKNNMNQCLNSVLCQKIFAALLSIRDNVVNY